MREPPHPSHPSPYRIPDLFDARAVEEMIARIGALTPGRQPRWGRMTVAEMLAHSRVAYAMALRADFPRPNVIMRLMLRLIVKPQVTGPAPYRRNLPTAAPFRVGPDHDFMREQAGLIADLRAVQALGPRHFQGRPSPTLGPLTSVEWNVLLAKHLDHHLGQFGV